MMDLYSAVYIGYGTYGTRVHRKTLMKLTDKTVYVTWYESLHSPWYVQHALCHNKTDSQKQVRCWQEWNDYECYTPEDRVWNSRIALLEIKINIYCSKIHLYATSLRISYSNDYYNLLKNMDARSSELWFQYAMDLNCL